jgi:integrase
MARRKSYQTGNISIHRGQPTVRYYVFDGMGGMKYKRERLEGVNKNSNKKDLQKAAEPIMARVNEENNNPRKAKESVTFKAFIEGRWASYQKKAGLKDSTVYSYESIINNYLMPAFQDRLMNEITPSHITAFFDKLQNKQPKVSTKYALNIYGLINTMFEVAYQYDIIDNKPVRNKLHKPSHEAKEKPTLSLDQVKMVLSQINEEKRFFFVVLFVTGLRIGECCGLRWMNLDLERKELSITNSVWRGRLTTPKTKASERLLRIPEKLLQMFFDHRQQSPYKAEGDFIFSRPDGRALDPDHLREVILYPAMNRAKIEREAYSHGFHVFRHTAGSILYEKTGRMKLVQKALGHSREQTTSDIYVHVAPEAVAESVEIVAEELLADRDLFQAKGVELVN